jgi:hypothetical protein
LKGNDAGVGRGKCQKTRGTGIYPIRHEKKVKLDIDISHNLQYIKKVKKGPETDFVDDMWSICSVMYTLWGGWEGFQNVF